MKGRLRIQQPDGSWRGGIIDPAHRIDDAEVFRRVVYDGETVASTVRPGARIAFAVPEPGTEWVHREHTETAEEVERQARRAEWRRKAGLT